MFDEFFPGDMRNAATRMNDRQLCHSRRWQTAGSSDLSYMHMIKLALSSWSRRCCLLSSAHQNPLLAHRLYLHVPAFRVMTFCGKLYRCLGHHCCFGKTGRWLLQTCTVHRLGSTSCRCVKSKAHAHLSPFSKMVLNGLEITVIVKLHTVVCQMLLGSTVIGFALIFVHMHLPKH